MKRKIKIILAPILVIATIIGFSIYLHQNPAVFNQILDTSPAVVISLILLYASFILCLVGVLVGSLAMYDKLVSTQESFYITAYSSIVNFFGPGQSGPAVRAAYLKLKHGVSVKQYGIATLIYYGFYSLFSGIIILAAILPWWLSSLLAITGTAACLAIIQRLRKRNIQKTNNGFMPVALIGGFAVAQIIIQAAIYFIELHSIGSSAGIGQTLVYTGAANFALFVALTPGAIGFREAFLLFSQRLHEIPSNMIIAANVLDRAVYVILLALLFVVILLLRTRSRFAKLQIAITSK